MSKKLIIFIVIIVLIFIGGGVFWWFKIREIKGSPEDYVIKKTEQGKIVENKKAGLTVRAPEGWEVERIEQLEGSVVTHTKEIEGKMSNGMVGPPLTKGCGIETAVVYKKMNFEELKEYIKELHVGLGIKSEDFEIITIKNHQALKNTFDSELLGPSISICIPHKNKLYSFAVYWAPEEKEGCVGAFNNFLETVEIE